eukprot:tig00000025_g7926.t1
MEYSCAVILWRRLLDLLISGDQLDESELAFAQETLLGRLDLASFSVVVSRTEQADASGKTHVVYLLDIKADLYSKQVQRRYGSFCSLHKLLKRRHNNLPSLPPKSIWRWLALDEESSEKQPALLQEYLSLLLKMPDVRRSPDLLLFLDMQHLLAKPFEFFCGVQADWSRASGKASPAYLVLTRRGVCEWTMARSYADFQALDRTLRPKLPQEPPPLPSCPRLFGVSRTADPYLLQRYLFWLLRDPVAGRADELFFFLGLRSPDGGKGPAEVRFVGVEAEGPGGREEAADWEKTLEIPLSGLSVRASLDLSRRRAVERWDDLEVPQGGLQLRRRPAGFLSPGGALSSMISAAAAAVQRLRLDGGEPGGPGEAPGDEAEFNELEWPPQPVLLSVLQEHVKRRLAPRAGRSSGGASSSGSAAGEEEVVLDLDGALCGEDEGGPQREAWDDETLLVPDEGLKLRPAFRGANPLWSTRSDSTSIVAATSSGTATGNSGSGEAEDESASEGWSSAGEEDEESGADSRDERQAHALLARLSEHASGSGTQPPQQQQQQRAGQQALGQALAAPEEAARPPPRQRSAHSAEKMAQLFAAGLAVPPPPAAASASSEPPACPFSTPPLRPGGLPSPQARRRSRSRSPGGRRRPILIKNLSNTRTTKVVGGMRYDPGRMTWVGNEEALAAFERPAHTAAALIANLNRSRKPQVVGAMAFDPERQCWRGNEEALRAFAELDADADEPAPPLLRASSGPPPAPAPAPIPV